MKRFLALILAIIMMASCYSFNVSAETYAEKRISELLQIFPNGSYFSVNGEQCSHGVYGACDNCELTHILRREDLKQYRFTDGGSWTCLAFAKFAWYFIHGEVWHGSYEEVTRGKITADLFAKAVPGDMIYYFNSKDKFQHAAIFCGMPNNESVLLYHANSGGTNRVAHSTWDLASMSTNYGNGSWAKVLRIKSTDMSISEGTYQIVSALNGEKSALDISGQSKDNKANVHLWTRHGGDSQKFRIERDGEYYKITNVNSGKVLDVNGGSNKNGTNVFQYDSQGSNNQQWIFEDAGDGYYYIKSLVGAYLDVSGGKSKDGTNIQVYKGNQTASQKFRFIPIHEHSYTVKNEEAHPHREYRECSCGEKIFTDNTQKVTTCTTCYPYPEKPAVNLDTDGAIYADEPFSISWNNCANTDYYEVRVYDFDTGDNVFNNWTVNGTNSALSLGKGKYNVHVISINNQRLAAKIDYACASDALVVTINEKAAEQYTLYYDSNGGIEAPSPKTVSGNHMVTISDIKPSKSGYVFTGWAESSTADTPDYSENDVIQLDSDKTIYAVWKEEDSSSSEIVLTIDSTEAIVFGTVKYNDVAPIIVNDRTMLPARFVAENLGADVRWDDEEKCAVITSDTTEIEIYIGASVAYVNGESRYLDSPAFIQNGRTYTPLRFICEALGADVKWLPETQEVVIRI